jgi:hypothetical protein
MSRKWSRRRFLRTTAGSTLVVGGPSFLPAWPWRTTPGSVLSAPERESLRLAIDELIPREPGRSAASDVGGVVYMEGRTADDEAFAGELKRVLALLEEAGRGRFGRPFAGLAKDQRIDALRDLERTAGDLFGGFRDAVYEAYYTQAEVWTRIGYEFHAGVEARSSVPVFDESVLASVRKLPKCYREVG